MDDFTSLDMTVDRKTVFNKPSQENKYTCDYVKYRLIIRIVLSINEQAIINFILMIQNVDKSWPNNMYSGMTPLDFQL